MVVMAGDSAAYFCDPSNGSMQNDGGPESPWGSLQAVFESGKKFNSGDVIFLRDGYHGEPTVTGANSDFVYIQPDHGAKPTFSRLTTSESSSYWHISGVQISRSFAPELTRKTMATISGSHNRLTRSTIFTVADVSAWTLDDWLVSPSNGVSMSGTENVLESCAILNTSFAVQVDGTFNIVRGNHIRNFSGDGMRGLGDDLVFEYNTVTDNYNIDDNHDDGFQSWSTGPGGVGTGVVHRITLRGNTIIETTDPARPFQGSLQGIGCFDGMFEDWVIENNVVNVNQWHGIAFYGAINCRIINNTVVDQDMSRDPGPTWITVQPHKKWATSTTDEDRVYYRGRDNLIRNNLTTAMSLGDGFGTVDHNKVITTRDFLGTFVNYRSDFHLKAGSLAIDAGFNEEAPPKDADGIARPFDGNADGSAVVDLGAYEYGAAVEEVFELIDVSGRQYLQVALDKYLLDLGAWYAVQGSSDLVSWSPLPRSPDVNSAFDVETDTFRYYVLRDRTPVDSESPRFVRVMVTATQ